MDQSLRQKVNSDVNDFDKLLNK